MSYSISVLDMISSYGAKKVDLVYKGREYRLISRQNRTPKPPTPPGKERTRSSNEALTEEQISSLIERADDLFDRTVLILGFSSGLRISEISGIETGRIDFDHARIKIWDEKKDKDRNVFVGDRATNAIRLYIAERRVSGLKLFEFSAKTFERHFQALTESVIGQRRSWHTVRHSYVTLCAKRGIDIKLACENTGDTPATILKVYNNPSLETMKEQANLVLPQSLVEELREERHHERF